MKVSDWLEFDGYVRTNLLAHRVIARKFGGHGVEERVRLLKAALARGALNPTELTAGVDFHSELLRRCAQRHRHHEHCRRTPGPLPPPLKKPLPNALFFVASSCVCDCAALQRGIFHSQSLRRGCPCALWRTEISGQQWKQDVRRVDQSACTSLSKKEFMTDFTTSVSPHATFNCCNCEEQGKLESVRINSKCKLRSQRQSDLLFPNSFQFKWSLRQRCYACTASHRAHSGC